MSETSAPVEALREPTTKVSWVFVLSITLANIGILMVLITPLNNLLPRYADAITGGDGKEAALAWVSAVGAVAAMLFNRWPGRCPTARRHAWAVVGPGSSWGRSWRRDPWW